MIDDHVKDLARPFQTLPCEHPYLVSVTTDLNTGADLGLCGECREWSQIGAAPSADPLSHPPRRGLWQRLVEWVGS